MTQRSCSLAVIFQNAIAMCPCPSSSSALFATPSQSLNEHAGHEKTRSQANTGSGKPPRYPRFPQVLTGRPASPETQFPYFQQEIDKAIGLSNRNNNPSTVKTSHEVPLKHPFCWPKLIHQVIKDRVKAGLETKWEDVRKDLENLSKALSQENIQNLLKETAPCNIDKIVSKQPDWLRKWLRSDSTTLMSVADCQLLLKNLPVLKQTLLFKNEELRNALLHNLVKAVQGHQDLVLLQYFLEPFKGENFELAFKSGWVKSEIRRHYEMPDSDLANNAFEKIKKKLILDTLVRLPMAEELFDQTPAYFLPAQSTMGADPKNVSASSADTQKTLTAYLDFASSQVLQSPAHGFNEKLESFVQECTDSQLIELLRHIHDYVFPKISESHLQVLNEAVAQRTAPN